jgi:hypothetical protein
MIIELNEDDLAEDEILGLFRGIRIKWREFLIFLDKMG